MTITIFIAGLIFLIIGAEALVRGASSLAVVLGISPLIIGLTVVAFGTSSPELAVSIKAALTGQSSIALGNVIGSNIFNVLFIIGISALVMPLVVSQQLLRLDVPLMIVLSLVVLIFSLDENISRADGLVLVSGLIIYIWFLFYQCRKENIEENKNDSKAINTEKIVNNNWLRNIALVIFGLAMLVLGSRWLVDSAVFIAHYLGVSELVIGLTIVAIGTSLPELVTSVIAAMRGERDIAVGNIIGSNIFNIMGVLGFASIVAPQGINILPAVIGFDIPVMIAVAFICLPMFFTGSVISRAEGALLLGYYIAYTLYLFLAASHHDALPSFSAAMLYLIIPLTMLTLFYMVFLQFIRHKKC